MSLLSRAELILKGDGAGSKRSHTYGRYVRERGRDAFRPDPYQHRRREARFPSQSTAQIKNSLPKLFPGATERQNNIMVHPLSEKVHFVQLDDLDAEALTQVGEAAFLTLATSPGNHQAWVAVSDIKDAEEAKVFARMLRQGAGADKSASGATRVTGTVNYKRKYEPEFPMGRIGEAHPSRVVTKAQLEGWGPRFRTRARHLYRRRVNKDTTNRPESVPSPHEQSLAAIRNLARRCAAQSRRNWSRPQRGGLYLVHDGNRLGLEHRGDSPEAAGNQRKCTRTRPAQGPGISAHHCTGCRR